ncbi:hypothetical protein F5144DRAFT_163459 [Chaetomium tenue]|uniref:Uncharacterized protein n=1 Tax=Chaetomium tenue TaxID=1854479 RepID=A0ACB7PCK1_9PEZI|nr:hypothetical protein F5144DRAFT_163459 [Chaetomium globosum]
MGRWSHLDTDEERLPDGMTRVGYDGDTQVYTYQDSDGSYWEGAPGVKYGRLYRVQQSAPVLPSAYVTGNITGHEAHYVLHDYDPDADADADNRTLTDENRPPATRFSQIFGEDGDNDDDNSSADEKKRPSPTFNRLPSFPSKAVLSPSPKRKPAPKLPIDADSMSVASTLVDRSDSTRSRSTITSDLNTPARRQNAPTSSNGIGGGGGGLKRSGTLSKLAQFITTSTSGITRRATVAGGGAANRRADAAGWRRAGPTIGAGGWFTPLDEPWPGPARRSEAGAGAGAGVGAGVGAGAGGGGGGGARGARARKRATTFDEILGVGSE